MFHNGSMDMSSLYHAIIITITTVLMSSWYIIVCFHVYCHHYYGNAAHGRHQYQHSYHHQSISMIIIANNSLLSSWVGNQLFYTQQLLVNYLLPSIPSITISLSEIAVVRLLYKWWRRTRTMKRHDLSLPWRVAALPVGWWTPRSSIVK